MKQRKGRKDIVKWCPSKMEGEKKELWGRKVALAILDGASRSSILRMDTWWGERGAREGEGVDKVPRYVYTWSLSSPSSASASLYSYARWRGRRKRVGQREERLSIASISRWGLPRLSLRNTHCARVRRRTHFGAGWTIFDRPGPWGLPKCIPASG